MENGARILSRTLPKRFALLTFLLITTLLFFGLAYRAFVHVDVAVSAGSDAAAAVGLMQQLDSLDVDYRLRKDGTILVDDADSALLAEAGVPVTETTPAPNYLRIAGLMLALLLSGMAAITVAMQLFRQIAGRRQRCETPPETVAEEAEPAPVRAPAETLRPEAAETVKLFESEHPQTVAVYLLGLNPEKAAEALEAMPQLQRERVWKRMASSGECDPLLRRKVAELFSAKMKRLRKRLRPAETTAKMVSIFRLLSHETRMELLSMLRREDAGDEIIAILEA